MTLDQSQARDFARSYTDAWRTHDPAKVAEHYASGGTIAINGGAPTEITEAAQSFMTAFPDIEVFMDDVVVKDDVVEYHWTFTGTNTGPGGTGKWVRISGFEEWTFGDDGLVAESKGHYDQAEYDRQLEHGASDEGLHEAALSSSDLAALRAAERALAKAFEAPDPTAWVDSYTDDAIFVGPGMQAIEGRRAFLDAARELSISSMEIAADSTLGAGDFAATLGRANWVAGPRGSDAPTHRRRFLMVWRREPDGHWRIARELLNEDV